MIKATLLTRRSQYGGAKFRAENGSEQWLQVPADIVLTGGECMIELTADGKGISSFVPVSRVDHSPSEGTHTPLCTPQVDTQRLIVRQSCLKVASEFALAQITAQKAEITPELVMPISKNILLLAEEYEKWVFRDK